MTTTHCQVCGREIRSASGLIAYHGYHGGWGGWKIGDSCPGARHLPYEISSDRLQPTIDAATRYLENACEVLENFFVNPPDSYTGHYGGESYTVTRPTDFDPRRPRGAGILRSYAAHFTRQLAPLNREVRMTEANVDYMRRRLIEWRAPNDNTRGKLQHSAPYKQNLKTP